MNERMDKYLAPNSSRERREKRFHTEFRKKIAVEHLNIKIEDLYVALRHAEFAVRCLPPVSEIRESLEVSVGLALGQFIKRK